MNSEKHSDQLSSQGTPASEACTPDLLNTVFAPGYPYKQYFRLNLISQPELKCQLQLEAKGPGVNVRSRPTRSAWFSFCLVVNPPG